MNGWESAVLVRADELGKGEIAKVDYLTWVTTKYMVRRYLPGNKITDKRRRKSGRPEVGPGDQKSG